MGDPEKSQFVDASPANVSAGTVPVLKDGLHMVARGEQEPDQEKLEDDSIIGFKVSLMKDRIVLTSEEEKKVLRRIDLRLLPLLALMYIVKTMDFSNVSNARIMDYGTKRNILTELNISSNQYNLIPYIVAEVPANLLLKYMKPSVWQSRVMVRKHPILQVGGLYLTRTQGILGHCTLLPCRCDERHRPLIVRAFLGLFEAGLWPGILLQLCYWYRPDELPKRIVFVTIFGNFSAVFSGVLAFAFNGVYTKGLSGWKWLILTEGLFTVVLGIVVFFVLPDFPSTVAWLSDRERSFIQARHPINSPRTREKDFDWKEFKTTFEDYKLWLFLGIWAFYTTGTTGLNFYQPTVVASLGFTTIGQAQLLNIPPAVLSCALVILFGWLGSTGRVAIPAIPLFIMISIQACYAVEYTYPNTGGVYAATTIAGGFQTAWFNLMWPWVVQTLEGATGSALAIAIANSYGQIGGALGPQLFSSKFAPHYTTSFAIAMGLVGIAILMACVTWAFTYKVVRDTRRIRRARKAAMIEGRAVLDDVDIHAYEKQKALSDSI